MAGRQSTNLLSVIVGHEKVTCERGSDLKKLLVVDNGMRVESPTSDSVGRINEVRISWAVSDLTHMGDPIPMDE